MRNSCQITQTVLHFLRQQNQKASSLPNYYLSDFMAPLERGRQDYIGGFAVTAGIGIASLLEQYERDHDDDYSIMVKARCWGMMSDLLLGGTTSQKQ